MTCVSVVPSKDKLNEQDTKVEPAEVVLTPSPAPAPKKSHDGLALTPSVFILIPSGCRSHEPVRRINPSS